MKFWIIEGAIIAFPRTFFWLLPGTCSKQIKTKKSKPKTKQKTTNNATQKQHFCH